MCSSNENCPWAFDINQLTKKKHKLKPHTVVHFSEE